MDLQDKSLICTICGKNFLFTSGEQKLTPVEPKDCPECKLDNTIAQLHKASSKAHEHETDGSNPSNKQIRCSRCGKITSIPFHSKTDSSVYCSSCFLQSMMDNLPPQSLQRAYSRLQLI